jgi:putative methyltransferase (TIGR04325 family)
MKIKELIKLVTPPFLLKFGKRLLPTSRDDDSAGWEYIPEGWSYATTHPEVKGWNVADVLESYKTKWQNFVKRTEGTAPLGVAYATQHITQSDISTHNTIMAFAYALSLAAHKRDAISILDWGGGIGHYYMLAQALLPDVQIDYYCNDLPLLAAYGAELFPMQHFSSDNTCFEKQYDFVLASSSLFYVQEWQSLFARLAHATRGFIFVTRLPIVFNVPSFVFLQRAYSFGYNTEYLGWCLNRQALLDEATRLNLVFIREFVTGESWQVRHAPEECQNRGFLFRPKRNQDG